MPCRTSTFAYQRTLSPAYHEKSRLGLARAWTRARFLGLLAVYANRTGLPRCFHSSAPQHLQCGSACHPTLEFDQRADGVWGIPGWGGWTRDCAGVEASDNDRDGFGIEQICRMLAERECHDLRRIFLIEPQASVRYYQYLKLHVRGKVLVHG